MEKKTRKDIVEHISDDRVATAITTVMFKKFVILGSPHISAPLSCDVHFSDLREHASFHCENAPCDQQLSRLHEFALRKSFVGEEEKCKSNNGTSRLEF